MPLPAAPEAFLGRNVETYRVVSAILDRRLVSVVGPAGAPLTLVYPESLLTLVQCVEGGILGEERRDVSRRERDFGCLCCGPSRCAQS